jgi:Zn finger protein HypA/HybF involved in hydrogenase expression
MPPLTRDLARLTMDAESVSRRLVNKLEAIERLEKQAYADACTIHRRNQSDLPAALVCHSCHEVVNLTHRSEIWTQACPHCGMYLIPLYQGALPFEDG